MGDERGSLSESWWLFDAAPDAVVGVDQHGEIVFANSQAGSLFGWAQEDMVGQPIEILVPEGRRDRHPAHRRGYSLDPRPRPMGAGLELYGQRRDGTEFPAEISLGPVTDDDAGVLVIAAVRDVTEQRRAQARFRALLEGAPDSVVGLERDGLVVLLNAQAEQRFGTSRTEAVGAPFPDLLAGTVEVGGEVVDLVPEHDRRRLEQAVGDVLDGSRHELTLRYRLARPDGPFTVLEAHGRAVREPTGTTGGMLLISRDVSEHVRLETALRAAKDEADRANEAKNSFLSRVSHELRTPLNAILGFGQLLEMQDLSAEDAESVRQVLRGGRHLLGLVNEVLDIARIESQELVLESGPVLVADVVGELLDLLAPLADERQVALDEGSRGACEAWVVADRERLKQVLLNLLSNGIKYNQPGGRVSVRTVAGGGVARIEVVDTGWGIPAEDQGRLFQPFDRLGAALTDIEGTGIGLTLSKGLVEAMGGTIGFESAAGAGSTFWVELRVADAQAADADRRVPTPTGGSSTVLLVEDDAANVLLAQRILQRIPGVRTVVATTGAQGLEVAQATPPDLVLLDLHLPDMGGEDVLAALQAAAATRSVPTVILSADADPERLAALGGAGAAGCLTKPLDVRAFLRLVSELVGAPPD